MNEAIEGEDLAAPKEIVDLVERFENNLASYKSGHYNETQVRREFVDPFFKALGWDIDNEQGFAEAYKDVIHEDAIKVGGTTRAPDYSFRIGGQRKFFLETKKPSVDIKEDIHPAFQLRRYAWTAKLPLSILTDFEEFSVYDCTIKPDKKDMPSKGRILYLTCRDYLEQWDEIAAIFSKNVILMPCSHSKREQLGWFGIQFFEIQSLFLISASESQRNKIPYEIIKSHEKI